MRCSCLTERYEIVSPVDGSVASSGVFASNEAIGAALDAAERTSAAWRHSAVQTRVDAVHAIVQEMIKRREQLANATMWHIGRPIADADELGAVEYIADFYSKDLVERGIKVPLPTDGQEMRSASREPLGVAVSICAWNYPVAMTAGLLLAPLLAGNAVLFKHSPQVAGIADLLSECITSSGVDVGLVQVLHATNDQVGAMLGGGQIQLLNFIGSEAGGRAVRGAAAGQFVKENLELGGKDAAWVRQDADIERAASEICWGAFGNSGQSCCSVERLYVDAAVYDQFVEALIAETGKLLVGDPRADVRIGPVVSAAAGGRIREQIASAVAVGARVITDARPDLADLGDAYLAPTIITNVSHDMTIMQDECFGPVLGVMRVDSDQQAVQLMNHSRFGLTASIWTADLSQGLALAQQMAVGNVYLNRSDYVDDHLPWGGVGASGLGRMDGFSWLESLTETRGYYVRAADHGDVGIGSNSVGAV
jgi:acyl-CoA reductase-like NAD-dependent aldehyde dehydrogenase